MIRLDDLAHRVGADLLGPVGADHAEVRAVAATQVSEVEHDSRLVKPGALFACIPGATADGHDFADAAIRAGAEALLVDRPIPAPVPCLVVKSVRRALGPISAAVHGDPSQQLDVVGVTGTNGKTTTVRLIAGLLRATGSGVSEIGTLTGMRTTPEAPELQRQLASAASRGDRAVAIEVSSHALDQHRVDGCLFRVAAFTNLGRDHLDYHGSREHYFAAKARLFSPGTAEQAVIDVTTEAGRRLADMAAAAMPVIEIGHGTTELLTADARSSLFRWRGRPVHLPLGAAFNVANAAVAAEVAVALGLDPSLVAEQLAGASQIPGRFESVDAGQDFSVIVDYAHTPEGLAAVLGAARDLAKRRLIVVFGAGGERDRQKRPAMGRVASALADRMVVTNDNPRSEDPAKIIAGIAGGMSRAPDVVEPDRRLAVRHAIAAARRGDVVVIAGKGHETTQTIGAEVLDFDDRLIALEELDRRQTRDRARQHERTPDGNRTRQDKR